MNSKRAPDLYQLSQQLEQAEEQHNYYKETKQIINAYRQVEQLKVQKPKSALKEEQNKKKPTSTYAAKVKETLSQLKNNQKQEMTHLNKHLPHSKQDKTTDAQNNGNTYKLQRSAVARLFAVLEQQQTRLCQKGLQLLIKVARADQQTENEFILRFRKFKLFRAWKDEFILSKIVKQRQQQQERQQLVQDEELACQFRSFALLKRTYRAWLQVTKRTLKKKQYEEELRMLQLQRKTKAEQQRSKKKEASNPDLQHKLAGFLNGLKHQIEHKERLNTIKENTEESVHNIQPSQHTQNIQETTSRQHSRQSQEDEAPPDSEVVIQPPSGSQPKKQLTNDQLQKRRKQLQDKHKKRKEDLSKLRKQKEQKKREEQKTKADLERQIEEQQKMIKQEKYRQYLKNKQQQEEWEKKEKELQIRADEFNQLRLLKFHGWLPLLNIKAAKRQNGQSLYNLLLMVVYRVKATVFLKNLEENCSKVLENDFQRMRQRYRRETLRRCLKQFSEYLKVQLQTKQQLESRHEVYHTKIVFAAWKRVHPELVSQNFDWERPRRKRAEEFHRIYLMRKALSALHEHKVEQQRNKLIDEQKQKIKNRIKDLLDDSEEFNIQEFL